MLPIYNYLLMDLYKLRKNFYIKFKFSFLIWTRFFKKFSQIVFRTSAVRGNEIFLPYVFKKLSAVRVSEISTALSAVGVNEIFSILKVSVLSSKCLFRIFPRSTDFPGLSFLFTGLESNGLRPDPLAGPRSCQRAPRWIQRCTRLWRLTCHFGKRTWVNSCFSSDRWRCPDWLYRWANRFDVDWLDEMSVSSITMGFVIFLDPIVSVCLAETSDLPSEGPLLRDRVLKSDSLARSE